MYRHLFRISPRLLFILPLLLAFGVFSSLALSAPAHANAVSYDLEVDSYFYYDCTQVGGGVDLIHLTGTMHIVFAVTYDTSGGVSQHTSTNFQGVKGTGLLTGTIYKIQEISHIDGQINGGPYETTSTIIYNLSFIGQGQGTSNNFSGHATLHYTINNNGTLTAIVDSWHNDC